jgi:hypothetical protein
MNTIVLILLGLIMSITIGGMLALIATSGMKDGAPRVIITIILSLVIGFGIMFLLVEEQKSEVKKWNNGVCAICHTKWHFQSATYGKTSTTYYYTCENGHIIKTDNLYQK